MAFFYAHSIWFLLFIAAMFICIWLNMCKKRLGLRWWSIPLFALATVVYAVFCAKLFSAAENGPQGGMSLYGGLFGMPLAFFLGAKLSKRKMAEVFDIFTIPALITVLFARINCLVAGCCRGLTIPHTLFRWPVREAEIIFYIVFIFVVGRYIYRQKMYGRAYPLYMFSYSILRFLLEFFRESDQTGVFHRAHLWAVIAILIGLGAFLFLTRRKRDSRKRRKSEK